MTAAPPSHRPSPGRRLPARLAPWLAVALAVGACRKTDRLPPRPEESDGLVAVADAAPSAPAAPAVPRRLSAAGRPEPQQVVLQTADGVSLVGDYFPPAEAGAPVIVLIHGANGRRLDFQALVDRILPTPTARPAVLAFDLRGHGESVHAGTATLQASALRDAPAAGADSWAGLVADVAAALAWVRGRPEIGGKAVLVGIGVGAVAAALATASGVSAPRRADVVGLIALSPAEEHGLAFGAQALSALAARGVRAVAVAAEDDGAAPPLAVRALEAGLGTSRADAEVLATGGHGVELLERHADVAARVLAFLRRMLGGSADFHLACADGAVLQGSLDRSLDGGGPVVVLVHDVGHDRTSLDRLREALVDRLPYDVVSFDLPGYGKSVAPAVESDGGEAGGAPGWQDDVPPEDPRSWWAPVRDVEALLRVVAGGGAVDGAGEGVLRFGRRPAYAIVAVGMGGTIAVEAAGELAGDASLPPLAGLALISPIASAHGLGIWEPLGERLLPRGVRVFAAAGSRELATAGDAPGGLGSVAQTVQKIATMFGAASDVRIFTTDAHGDALIRVHPDVLVVLEQFLHRALEHPPSGGPASGEPASGDASGDQP